MSKPEELHNPTLDANICAISQAMRDIGLPEIAVAYSGENGSGDFYIKTPIDSRALERKVSIYDATDEPPSRESGAVECSLKEALETVGRQIIEIIHPNYKEKHGGEGDIFFRTNGACEIYCGQNTVISISDYAQKIDLKAYRQHREIFPHHDRDEAAESTEALLEKLKSLDVTLLKLNYDRLNDGCTNDYDKTYIQYEAVRRDGSAFSGNDCSLIWQIKMQNGTVVNEKEASDLMQSISSKIREIAYDIMDFSEKCLFPAPKQNFDFGYGGDIIFDVDNKQFELSPYHYDMSKEHKTYALLSSQFDFGAEGAHAIIPAQIYTLTNTPQENDDNLEVDDQRPSA